jgi:hypothetical protein
MNDIIQLKISLQGTKPLIWRRVLVEKSTSFFKLHYIIQYAMGWENSHLFEFNVKGSRIGEPNEYDEGFGGELIDASRVTIGAMISGNKGTINYTYDFGDSWEHLISVEKILPNDANLKYPICIDGALSCPPEDCGGVWGFYDLLKTIENKKYPEYKDTLEWIGGKYDAEYFDKKLINVRLSKLSYKNKKVKTLTISERN